MKHIRKNWNLLAIITAMPILAIGQNGQIANPETADPFANPFAGGNNTGAAPLQTSPDPFAASGGTGQPVSPFGTSAGNNAGARPANPFGNSQAAPVPNQAAPVGGQPANPFGAPGTGSGGGQPANPFGNSTAPAQPANPFGGGAPAQPANPFGAGTGVNRVEDPFGQPPRPQNVQPPRPQNVQPPAVQPQNNQPQNPFGSGGAPVTTSTDPFGSGGSNQPVSPFGSGGADSGQPTSPFGNATADTGQPVSPFGNQAPPPGAGNTAPNPFGAGAPAINAGPANNNAVASPFGDNQDPFGGGGAASPFGNDTSTASGVVSPFGGSDGNDGPAVANPFDQVARNPFEESLGESSSPFDSGIASNSDFGTGGTSGQQSINELSDFRYEIVTRWDGTQFVVRRKLSKELAEEFDQRAKDRLTGLIGSQQLPGYDGTTPPDIWADWAHYADQLELWSRYIDRTVLAGFPSMKEDVDTAYSRISWPGTQQEQGGNNNNANNSTGNIINDAQNQSLDEQLDGLVNPFAGGGNDNQQANIFGPEVITDQVVTVFNSKVEELRTLEQTQETEFIEFLDRLAERKTRRLAYADWINDQESQIEEVVLDWDRRYNGTVANIGGVRYELYRPGQVPENVQRDAVVVVTDFALTPYDILNPEDGTLKE